MYESGSSFSIYFNVKLSWFDPNLEEQKYIQQAENKFIGKTTLYFLFLIVIAMHKQWSFMKV